jgi:hypothetical protein
MRPSLRVLATLATLAVVLAAAPAALAGPPAREVISLNDPAIDVDESAWASNLCGFPVDADVSGHIQVIAHDGTGHVLGLDVYGIRATYRNPDTGATFHYRDIGPDRVFVKDGRVYVAVTGRSSGSGVIGVVVIDVEADEVVHVAGNDVGDFYDGMCETLAA